MEQVTTDPDRLLSWPEVDGVIIATPNFTHRPLAVAAARAGKHIMCEKPLGLNSGEVAEMYRAARDAGVVHMTAFTYRFAPAMGYLRHLVKSGALGEPRHFRSQRFLDWPETSWGWRQYKESAGAGNLFDMMIHRIDFALDLLGPLRRICGAVARFAPRERTGEGSSCPASDVDDWSAMIGEFESGSRGCLGGNHTGQRIRPSGIRSRMGRGQWLRRLCGLSAARPNQILLGKTGHDLEPIEVPAQYLKPSGSPRDPARGEPATVFRYDLVWEFVSAIVEKRQAIPSFLRRPQCPARGGCRS